MRTLSKFSMAVAATVAIGLLTALLGVLDLPRLALGGVGLSVALLGVLIFLSDRRARGSVRKDAGARIDALEREVRRTSAQVDMMQRRVIATLETARLEAADRARDAASGVDR